MIVLIGIVGFLLALGIVTLGMYRSHHGVVWCGILLACVSVWCIVGGIAVSAAEMI